MRNTAFVPVFPALFSFCSLVPNEFMAMFYCSLKPRGGSVVLVTGWIVQICRFWICFRIVRSIYGNEFDLERNYVFQQASKSKFKNWIGYKESYVKI